MLCASHLSGFFCPPSQLHVLRSEAPGPRKSSSKISGLCAARRREPPDRTMSSAPCVSILIMATRSVPTSVKCAGVVDGAACRGFECCCCCHSSNDETWTISSVAGNDCTTCLLASKLLPVCRCTMELWPCDMSRTCSVAVPLTFDMASDWTCTCAATPLRSHILTELRARRSERNNLQPGVVRGKQRELAYACTHVEKHGTRVWM